MEFSGWRKNKALKLVPGSNNIKNTSSGESTNKISLDKDVFDFS